MYREVEESLTSCELVQALCLNIPPHKQQDRSIFDLEEEEVENLPIHDQHDLQGNFYTVLLAMLLFLRYVRK